MAVWRLLAHRIRTVGKRLGGHVCVMHHHGRCPRVGRVLACLGSRMRRSSSRTTSSATMTRRHHACGVGAGEQGGRQSRRTGAHQMVGRPARVAASRHNCPRAIPCPPFAVPFPPVPPIPQTAQISHLCSHSTYSARLVRVPRCRAVAAERYCIRPWIVAGWGFVHP